MQVKDCLQSPQRRWGRKLSEAKGGHLRFPQDLAAFGDDDGAQPHRGAPRSTETPHVRRAGEIEDLRAAVDDAAEADPLGRRFIAKAPFILAEGG